MMALIDSGADRTILPGEVLAGHPTIAFDALPELKDGGLGAGGAFKIRECKGILRWREWDICDRFQVAEPGKLEMPLLGREDFFKLFFVRFRWDRTPPIVDIDPPGKPSKKKKKK
jgi:hypothetical protein